MCVVADVLDSVAAEGFCIALLSFRRWLISLLDSDKCWSIWETCISWFNVSLCLEFSILRFSRYPQAEPMVPLQGQTPHFHCTLIGCVVRLQ
jgi:hypothetical protein